MKQRPHYIKFSDEMKRDVRRLIVYGQYSPEQIAGRYKRDGKPMVCKETIYKCVWSEKRKGILRWPRKSLGYLTPLEYFKKIYKFDFGSRCTSN